MKEAKIRSKKGARKKIKQVHRIYLKGSKKLFSELEETKEVLSKCVLGAVKARQNILIGSVYSNIIRFKLPVKRIGQHGGQYGKKCSPVPGNI